MQGVFVDDAGFSVDPVSTTMRFENFSLAPQSPNVSASTLSLKIPKDLNSISEFTEGTTVTYPYVSWSPRAASTLCNCNSNLWTTATSHSSSTPHSRPSAAEDHNIKNAADGESVGGKFWPSSQDFEVNTDFVELASNAENSSLFGSNSGMMMEGLFCDLKNLSGGVPLQTKGTCGDSWSADDLYSCDEFRMYEFKVRSCMRGRSHDWTECPFAHPGEKARRRDPHRFHYSAIACADFRKGNCKRGDDCEFAHGVFECWLHPARYRTQPCKDGRNCKRRVCFFAHTPEQLRLLPEAAQAAIRNGGSCRTQLSALKACIAQNGSCCGSFDGSSSVQSFCSDSFDGSNVPYDSFGCLVQGLFDGSCSWHDGCHGGSPRIKAAAQLSSFNCSNQGGICCASSQVSSPTSTLFRLTQSPLTLSPPPSPIESPPASPSNWHSTFSHSLSVAAAHGAFRHGQAPSVSRASDSPSPSQSTASQAQALLAAHGQISNSVAGSAGNIPHNSVQRHHMESLNSKPTLAIPNCGQRRLLQTFASAPSSPHSTAPTSTTVVDLVAAVQQLELKGANPMWIQTQAAQAPKTSPLYSSGLSPLRRCSQSVPCTPSGDEEAVEMWDADIIEEEEANMPRVESGRALRAKIYGKLRKDKRLDCVDSFDLGWVNELVKE
ncbi:hypothetical protein O6H91_04G130900 [Diphasiastrum complanatum]|uniref:Uncharacterized protein n=5 Tax=Diphasiastrum complanatum TaxID=34168 RepID=A0ACC2E1Y0_DIPCM|nr:hypothetical protein O6H91_04G130900 [Diphasiastrum complanatum]KAJ7560456.1 hypothetical protein O6H91_04G130900 [Diphasiastrum complanatum]KAJ7560457.1 hypothetical protein O6H91_04G130900 [Diphasiastrum complanatum]KAJ7560458.1 hypothetical protein O6H91_04G130900 [Diphasiastrum complanatum]KAJ7560459.1 hypothetical protein O6H91_04G130900 [Diphasiastrum complanatum]